MDDLSLEIRMPQPTRHLRTLRKRPFASDHVEVFVVEVEVLVEAGE